MIRAILLAALLATPAAGWAREVTDADREAVSALVDQVDAAMRQGDLMAATDVVPPRIFSTMAERVGMPEEELMEAMRAAMEEAMAEVEVVSSEMRLEEATEAETSSGRPYLLIPSETVLRVGGEGLRNETMTLALEDEGSWYLVRIDDMQQIQMLREVYPDFEGVEFPRGRMSAVE